MPTTGLHAAAAGTDLHEDKRIKEPVRAVATANVTISSPGGSIDSVVLVNGDRVLLTGQTSSSDNGIYLWDSGSTSMTRTTDAALASDFVFGFKVYAREGTLFGKTYWTYTQSASVTIGTTALTFSQDVLGTGNQSVNTVYAGPASGSSTSPAFRALVNADIPSPMTISGVVAGSAVRASGLTGTTTGGRFVGVMTSGHPTSGTFAVGDFVVDLTPKFYVCTGAGSPGTWVEASGSMSNPMTTNQDVIVGGSGGTPARLAVGSNGQVLGVVAGAVAWTSNPSGFANPMTTIGDLIAGDTGGTPLRVGVGSNGQVLTVVGGQPGWANPEGITNNAASLLYLASRYT